MKRIIGDQSSGKTRQLMEYAKANNAIFVCENRYAMESKALAYGIVGLQCMSYYDFLEDYSQQHRGEYYQMPAFVIDELERFVTYTHIGYNWQSFLGYSLTVNED